MKKRVQRAVPAVREISPADRILLDARRLEAAEEALAAETLASGWLGRAWAAAGLGERDVEHRLCLDVVDRVRARPSARGLAAIAALCRVAPESEIPLLNDAVNALSEGQPPPHWVEQPAARPVKAWRAIDVWDSRRVLWVEFDRPQPHTLTAWTMTIGGVHVNALGAYPPGAVQVWEKEVPQPEPMTLSEAPVDEVLAELADALRLTGMSWPRQHEASYVEWRSLAWARCRGHLTDLDSEPMPDDERARLIDDFVAAGAADDDVTRSVADLFLDYADSYLASGHLCWSPVAVQLLLSDWMPRKAILDADQRAAVPELLPRWVRFCLELRGVEPEWIQPVVDAVGESLPYFEEAFDDERAWGPAKQMVAEFEKLGVDLTDQAAVDDAISEVNAALLARRLLED